MSNYDWDNAELQPGEKQKNNSFISYLSNHPMDAVLWLIVGIGLIWFGSDWLGEKIDQW